MNIVDRLSAILIRPGRSTLSASSWLQGGPKRRGTSPGPLAKPDREASAVRVAAERIERRASAFAEVKSMPNVTLRLPRFKYTGGRYFVGLVGGSATAGSSTSGSPTRRAVERRVLHYLGSQNDHALA